MIAFAPRKRHLPRDQHLSYVRCCCCCCGCPGCTQLQSLTLHNTGITNRALYSLAHYSRALRDLEIEGYSEFITNTGVAVLAQARPGLRRCHLGGRLLKVRDSLVHGEWRHRLSSR